jgi:RimJ/RimL family protein N-acetyltransferase
VRLWKKVQEVPRGLRLRPLTADDAPALAAGTADPDGVWWLRERPPYTEDQVRAELAAATWQLYGIERDGSLSGVVSMGESDPQTWEVAYYVFPEARGQGVAPEAVRLLSERAFAERGAERLWLEVDPENTSSLRVAEKAGYFREGVLRSHCISQGVRHDCVIYSLLPSDLATITP